MAPAPNTAEAPGGWKPDALASPWRKPHSSQIVTTGSGAVPLSTYIEMQDKYLEATEAINATRLEVLRAALDLEQLIGAPAAKAQPQP